MCRVVWGALENSLRNKAARVALGPPVDSSRGTSKLFDAVTDLLTLASTLTGSCTLLRELDAKGRNLIGHFLIQPSMRQKTKVVDAYQLLSEVISSALTGLPDGVSLAAGQVTDLKEAGLRVYRQLQKDHRLNTYGIPENRDGALLPGVAYHNNTARGLSLTSGEDGSAYRPKAPFFPVKFPDKEHPLSDYNFRVERGSGETRVDVEALGVRKTDQTPSARPAIVRISLGDEGLQVCDPKKLERLLDTLVSMSSSDFASVSELRTLYDLIIAVGARGTQLAVQDILGALVPDEEVKKAELRILGEDTTTVSGGPVEVAYRDDLSSFLVPETRQSLVAHALLVERNWDDRLSKLPSCDYSFLGAECVGVIYDGLGEERYSEIYRRSFCELGEDDEAVSWPVPWQEPMSFSPQAFPFPSIRSIRHEKTYPSISIPTTRER